MLLTTVCKECKKEYSYDPRFDALAYTQGRCRECADRKGIRRVDLTRKFSERGRGHKL
ncbi:hypothetical protein Dthio_PD0368 [Desulfonatronospira thiodismutans ASO3-1]|uniref:Zinc-binding domain-containing protein n=1 Tax=Desulfonatronospira thiodismutans ASO3-1 TaxID=555779 RepID=D6SUS4_9BACT|nr:MULTISPECIES: hypothetical protein [Desulfonatronospira]EFI33054.1 hypothetical protein Dthio_PD0368 [Desulfonatronospira thiodismutans ASO3-1]